MCLCSCIISPCFFVLSVGLRAAKRNRTSPVDSGMSSLTSAFQKILKSSLSSSQVRLLLGLSVIQNKSSNCVFLLNAKSILTCLIKSHYDLKFQGNVGHMRVVPCGPTVFVRVRDNLCLMWTEPLTQGAQR